MSPDPNMSSSWTRAVDAVIRGDANHYAGIRLGRTPEILQQCGLGPHDLEMTAGKIAKARKEHPEVALQIWYELPVLLQYPFAIFPSTRDDGTVIVVIAVVDGDGNPVIVPIVPSVSHSRNVVLSVYGKAGNERLNGFQWIENQIAAAKREGKRVFEKGGSADSKPKPESADAISWSPDLISVDRSTEPKRDILSIRKKSTNS
jgi:Phage MuF-C-terminal domain